MTISNTAIPSATAAATETVAVPQTTSDKLSRFTRRALIAVAVVGAVAGACYFVTKTKKIVVEVVNESADSEPAAAAE